MEYAQTIICTTKGSLASIASSGHNTPERAREACAALARSQGWSQPKWWHFWRMRDTWGWENW